MCLILDYIHTVEFNTLSGYKSFKKTIKIPGDTHYSMFYIKFTRLIALFFCLSSTAWAQDAGNLADAAMRGDAVLVRQLLDQGANPDEPGQFGTSAIHWSVEAGNLDLLVNLLANDANPDLKTRYGVTPLALAIEKGSTVMAKLLLEAGADPETLDNARQSVLMLAAQSGELANVRALIESGASVDRTDEHFGQTALMFAARAGHENIVDYLLSQGADANARTDIGEIPKWVEPNSQRGFGFGIGIIRGGTPADRGRREPIPGGMTPLLYAARHGFTDIVDLLLQRGADIHLSDANDISPLLMAVENNQVETAKLLIVQGADLNQQDWYGRSPLWEAINVRNLYIHNDLFNNFVSNRNELLDLIKLLIEQGADVNVRTSESPPIRHHLLSITGTLEWVDFTGQTPFIRAARAGDMAVLELLLENNADPHITTFEGTNALMAAAGINWVVSQTWTESPENLLAAVKLCFELGMDVNHANSMGLAAIHGAANRGSNDIIEFLVENGARLDIKDNEGRSPLDWAKGVFLATHPAEEKPESMALITQLLEERNMSVQ